MRDKSLPLHTKYRPQNFDEFVGNRDTVESLQTILARTSGEVHSFLFTGPTGAGKTTLARIVATELGCSKQDFVEYNSASFRGIDTVREIANNCRYAPMIGKVKIYLLDESHKFSNDAQNALLKLLEDPPKHTRFILCTTDPEKLIKALWGRCTPFRVTSLLKREIMRILNWVCKEEGVEVPQTVLQKIVESSEGLPRQALLLLDQVIDIEDEKIALQVITNYSVYKVTVIDLCRKLLDPSSKWSDISKILSSIDDDPEKIRYSVLTYMTKVLLTSANDRAVNIIELFSNSFMYSDKAGLVSACYLTTKIKKDEKLFS